MKWNTPFCSTCAARHWPDDCPAYRAAAKEAGPGITAEANYRARKEDQRRKDQ